MITRTSVRVALASTLTACALAAAAAIAVPAVAAPSPAVTSAEHVVVFDDDQVRGLDRCAAIEADNTIRCTVLPAAALNRLVAEFDLDRPSSGPAAAEGLSAATSVTRADPRWR